MTTEQRAGEGAAQPADGEAGDAEEEPATSRRNSIPGSGAAPCDCPHHRLHPDHTSLRQQTQRLTDCQPQATSWLMIFKRLDILHYCLLYDHLLWSFSFFRCLSLRGSSSSDSVVQQPTIFLQGGIMTFLYLVLLHQCPDIQYFHLLSGYQCVIFELRQ